MAKNHSKSTKSVLKFRDLRSGLTQIKQILPFCLLPSILCISSVNADPKPTPSTPPPQLPTQTNTLDTNRAAAEKARAEAYQLAKQNAPYLTQIIPKFEEALKYWRLAKDRKKEALALDEIAKRYWLRGEYPKALEYALKALPICQALGDKECEGAVTTSLSLIYDQMGEYQKAIDIRLQIPSLFPKSLDLPSIAYSTVAHIYSSKLGEPKKALEYYNKDIAFWREKGDIVKQAESLDRMALFYLTSGEINQSFDAIKQANTLDPEFKRNTRKYNLYDVIYVGLNSSICADKLASIKKTPNIENFENSSKQSATPNSNAARTNLIENFKQKAEKWRKQELIRFEAENLSDLASLGYYNIGEYKKALAEYQKALKIRQIMGGKPEEAKTLTDIADILNKQGKKQEAINFLNQALEIQRQTKARPDEANTLVTIGNVYLSLGAYTESLRTYGQALSLWKNIGDRNKETDPLTLIGDVYRKLQDYPQALNYYQQALDISKITGDCANEAYLLERISRTYLATGDYQQAISFGNKTLNLSRNLGVNERQLFFEALTLNIRAQVEIKQGNYSQALEDAQKARKAARESGYRAIRFS
ncbi:MAG: tetratricopeptide repeat protein [Rhizonema sp. NSF051]|nr:tetratricopeptide repeat protein [Rhizonema sp. NSF051]